MTYRLSSLGDEAAAVPDGTSVLFRGPSAETEPLLYDAVAEGIEAGEAAIVITTNRSAQRVVDELAARDALATDRLGVVDCASGEEEPGDLQGVPVRQLSSPGDLTGLSLEFAKLLQGFDQQGVDGDVRVCLNTVSTLLMYNEVRTVFRFLHVFSSRIRSADLLGLFTLDPTMHDDQTTNTVRTIFDAEMTPADDGVELAGSAWEQG